MTKRELIEALADYPDDAPVYVWGCHEMLEDMDSVVWADDKNALWDVTKPGIALQQY